MTSAPTRRVETPQLVAQTYSCSLSLFWKVQSNALAKFCPRKWLVPAWSALPSCISASMVNVSTAPAKRSLAVLTPRTTGIAMYSSANVA